MNLQECIKSIKSIQCELEEIIENFRYGMPDSTGTKIAKSELRMANEHIKNSIVYLEIEDNNK